MIPLTEVLAGDQARLSAFYQVVRVDIMELRRKNVGSIRAVDHFAQQLTGWAWPNCPSTPSQPANGMV